MSILHGDQSQTKLHFHRFWSEKQTLAARLKPGGHRLCVPVLVGILSGFGWLAGQCSDMIHPEMALLICSACIVFI